jgi:hypothetical protein
VSGTKFMLTVPVASLGKFPASADGSMLAFEKDHVPVTFTFVHSMFLPIMSPAFDHVAVELVPVMIPVAVKAAQFKVPVNVGVALRTFRPVPVVQSDMSSL